MQQDLCVAVDTLIELVISGDSLVDVDLVADNKAGLCDASDDEVAQITIVSLDIALSGTEGKTLHRTTVRSATPNETGIRLAFSNSLPKEIRI